MVKHDISTVSRSNFTCVSTLMRYYKNGITPQNYNTCFLTDHCYPVKVQLTLQRKNILCIHFVILTFSSKLLPKNTHPWYILPTWMVDFYGKYTIPMGSYGKPQIPPPFFVENPHVAKAPERWVDNFEAIVSTYWSKESVFQEDRFQGTNRGTRSTHRVVSRDVKDRKWTEKNGDRINGVIRTYL